MDPVMGTMPAQFPPFRAGLRSCWGSAWQRAGPCQTQLPRSLLTDTFAVERLWLFWERSDQRQVRRAVILPLPRLYGPRAPTGQCSDVPTSLTAVVSQEICPGLCFPSVLYSFPLTFFFFLSHNPPSSQPHDLCLRLCLQ